MPLPACALPHARRRSHPAPCHVPPSHCPAPLSHCPLHSSPSRLHHAHHHTQPTTCTLPLTPPNAPP
ncbi:hypothetical protein DIS09_28660, partial [Burkholderia pseudomallei]